MVFFKYHVKKFSICLLAFTIGIGISYINFDFQQTSYDGIVFEAKDNYFLFISKGERLYVYEKEHQYEIGDVLSIQGKKEKTSFVTVESQFDFQDYLAKKGINYQLYPEKINVKFSNPLRIRAAQNALLSHFSEESASIVKSVLFSSSNSDFADRMSSLHLGRLLSASGFYIYIYISVISFLLSFLIKEKYRRLIATLTLIPYFICTFPKLSVIRILFLEIFMWINHYKMNDKFSRFGVISCLGIIILLVDYHYAYQDSFILGFTFPFVTSLIRKGSQKMPFFKRKIYEKITSYLFFIPFEIQYYNGTNPLSIVLHYLLSPLFIILGLSSLLCFYKIPIYGVVEFIVSIISPVISFLGKIKVTINGPNFNSWITLFYYVLVFAFIYYLNILFKPIYTKLRIIIPTFLFVYFVPINNVITGQVSFINVGQGDACLIRDRQKAILIDTGGSLYTDIAKDCLIPYLRKNRIYSLDLVITTHDDFDHSGAFNSLRENFKVKNYISAYEKFPLSVGDITFKNYNSHISFDKEDNENSLVIGFSFLHHDYLIMGDAPVSVEKDIMKEYKHIPCDVLKIGHHGSNTSTSEEFLNYLNPKDAIISVGKNNYGHPNKDIVSILERHHINIKRTDKMGTISYCNYIFM